MDLKTPSNLRVACWQRSIQGRAATVPLTASCDDFVAHTHVQLSHNAAAAVTSRDVCSSVTRPDDGRVSTKFVIVGEMGDVDFDRKGTQRCDRRDAKVYVSTQAYDSMECRRGHNGGWSANWNNFQPEHMCICESGPEGRIEYHLASTAECNNFVQLRNIR